MLLHDIHLDGLSPFHLELDYLKAEGLADLLPALAEFSSVDHQHLFTRREEIRDGRLHRARSRRGQSQHVVFCSKESLQTLPRLSKDLTELRRPVMNHRLGHSPDDLVRDGRGAWCEQILLNHFFFP